MTYKIRKIIEMIDIFIKRIDVSNLIPCTKCGCYGSRGWYEHLTDGHICFKCAKKQPWWVEKMQWSIGCEKMIFKLVCPICKCELKLDIWEIETAGCNESTIKQIYKCPRCKKSVKLWLT